MAELRELPTGWECKVDEKTGKNYFINHYTKTTTWEDPRPRNRALQTTPRHFSNMPIEHVPMQHGSPDLRRNYVYPSHQPPMPAFQIPGHHSPKIIPLQEFHSIPRMSPLSVRGNRVQDSSLTIVPHTDDAVSKINTMFPTVSETHIRLLMKKYHNREALVISALQVEKNPIATPGPFATPPPQRAPMHATPPPGVRAQTSRGGSPVYRTQTSSGPNSCYAGSPRMGGDAAYRSSPRPHSSPKLKLRYMKSIFPQAEETVILEVLQNNDNNIQKTSENLKEMGFDKKDTVKAAQQKLDQKKEEERIEEAKLDRPPTPPPILKSTEEKQLIKEKLKQKYKDVQDHLIKMALESVDFDESRANQILQIMVQEDKNNEKMNEIKIEEEKQITEVDSPAPSTLPISQSRMSIKSLLKSEKNDKEKTSFNRVIEENAKDDFKSPYLSNTMGRNLDITRGPNEKLLLEDYVKWQGPNANFRKGPQTLAKGSNKSLLTNRSYAACGPNSELRKGPKFSLAKGSIFSHMKSVMVGDARGK
ncbi:unnamed protein product [Brassicogethes aeneus]|uniref:Uncharacterized protein n=1 Tax=Brassicogethes aeneus TaxID=1431903 RepID=A0A9P0ATB7_BRAAE|nr:unnamed protein product [Brassicogethes aeneus]